MLQPIESPWCISGILPHDLLDFEQGNSWFFLLCFGCQRGKRLFWNWLPFCPRFSHCLGWWHHWVCRIILPRMAFPFLYSSCLRLSVIWPYRCRQRSSFWSRLGGTTSIYLSLWNFQRSPLVALPLILRGGSSFLLCWYLGVPCQVFPHQDLPLLLLCLVLPLLQLPQCQAWQHVFLLLLVSVVMQGRRWVIWIGQGLVFPHCQRISQ